MKILMLVITARTAGMIKPQQAASLVRTDKDAALVIADHVMHSPPNVEVSGELFEIDPDDVDIKRAPLPVVKFEGDI